MDLVMNATFDNSNGKVGMQGGDDDCLSRFREILT